MRHLSAVVDQRWDANQGDDGPELPHGGDPGVGARVCLLEGVQASELSKVPSPSRRARHELVVAARRFRSEEAPRSLPTHAWFQRFGDNQMTVHALRQHAILSLLATVLAACSSGGERQSSAATVTVTAAPSESATASESSPPRSSEATPTSVAPNVGGNALTLDAWREGTQIRTRVRSVTQAPDAVLPSYLVGDTSAEGAVALVEVCNRESAPEPLTGEVFSLFSARDGSGGQYTRASSSWDVWPPRPQFPIETNLLPGSCVSGWVLFSVPPDVQVAAITLDNGSEKLAEWLVG